MLSKSRKRKKFLKVLVSIFVVTALLFLSFFIYIADYYRADYESVEVFSTSTTITVENIDDNTMVFSQPGSKVGLIFYPGGKVEYSAYIPLMKACASKGITCVLLKMPFNLAVFDVDAADGIKEYCPEIDAWYMGGHSLGGSMAATYLSSNPGSYKGLVLLGAYSSSDISGTGVDVLSVYGSEDKVLNKEKYNEYLVNLPDDFTEVVIEGGCHAYFGMYSAQDGDGMPTISNSEQIEQTARIIENFCIKKHPLG